MLTIITGGSGSGKSSYAERMVLDLGKKKRIYIATMIPWDKECKSRIAKHRVMRQNKSFETLECYTGLETLELNTEPNNTVVLLECMSNLISNEFYRSGSKRNQVLDHILAGIRQIQKQATDFIIVTNEVFSDGMDYDEETMEYIKILGHVNQKLAEQANLVVEVVYGIPVWIKKDHTGGEE